MEALTAKGMPRYLTDMVVSYLSNRTIVYEGNGEPYSSPVYAGVPQDSVMGPFLWNVVYDDIIRRHNKDRVTFVAFADGLAILVSAVRPDVMERRAAEAYDEVLAWLEGMHMRLAQDNTEAMLLLAGAKRRSRPQTIKLGGVEVKLADEVKYLRVKMDKFLTIRAHIGDACRRANRAMLALAKLMRRTGAQWAKFGKVIKNRI